MKKSMVGLIVGILLIGFSGYAEADGDLIVNGKLGVGTTNPGLRFVVEETSLPSWNGTLGFGGYALSLKGLTPPYYPFIQWLDSSGTRGAYFGWGSAGSRIDFTLENGNKLAITGGNVGIGTYSPSQMLEVSGSIRISDSVGGHLVLGQNDSTDEGGQIDWVGAHGPSTNWSNWHQDIYRDRMRFWSDTVGAGNNLVLDDNGNVGIQNTNPTKLLTMEPNGISYYNEINHSWYSGSSGRWKSDIRPIKGALDTALKMNGVSFKWKKRTDMYETVKDGEQEIKKYISSSWSDDPNGRDDIGLIGEDVMKVLPEVVDVDEKNPEFAQGISYSKIVAVLIEAIKEQQKAIEGLRAELDQLKSK